MEIIKDTRHSAYMYVLGLDPAMSAAPFMTAEAWGPPTSSIIESINSLLLEERKASATDLLNSIWHKFMDLRFAALRMHNKRWRSSPASSRQTLHWKL